MIPCDFFERVGADRAYALAVYQSVRNLVAVPGMMVKVLSLFRLTLTLPLGSIVPPSPAVAVRE